MLSGCENVHPQAHLRYVCLYIVTEIEIVMKRLMVIEMLEKSPVSCYCVGIVLKNVW